MGENLVVEGTLTLPYGVLKTLHYGGGEVRLYRNLISQDQQVGKRISRLGREDALSVSEAALLRQIDHPNVAKIYDVAEVAGTDPALAIVEMTMPYYRDGSIFDAMRSGRRFGTGEARDLGVRALRGLAHLHHVHRILHRDLKTPNLFLSGDDAMVKVGDFGEAVAMDEAGEAAPLLSPGFWTAPETFTGATYTIASEVYSMGVAIREMTSGPIPYDEYQQEIVASRLAAGQPAIWPRHASMAPHVPDSLRRILRKSTRVNPSDRFSSTEEMIDALNCARFVDWLWPTEAEQDYECEGSWAGQRLRVRGRQKRDHWRFETERRYASGWRRLREFSAEAPERDAAAERVFRQIDRFVVRV